MGIPADLRDAWINRRKSILIASPAEEQKILRSKRCTEGHSTYYLNPKFHFLSFPFVFLIFYFDLYIFFGFIH
uniref:Uncharacterized protein n=1 Tax=Nelumbo nucifera TaxID=4432 RepID=A0A822ZEF1_NELNU|nr:TPA_asm: hypothetical protein HUJ06_002794 [Nelumbo nucifera]